MLIEIISKRLEVKMKESDILFEQGDFWVAHEKSCYTVYQNMTIYSVSDSSYAKNSDGLSIAIARCKYLANRSK